MTLRHANFKRLIADDKQVRCRTKWISGSNTRRQLPFQTEQLHARLQLLSLFLWRCDEDQTGAQDLRKEQKRTVNSVVLRRTPPPPTKRSFCSLSLHIGWYHGSHHILRCSCGRSVRHFRVMLFWFRAELECWVIFFFQRMSFGFHRWRKFNDLSFPSRCSHVATGCGKGENQQAEQYHVPLIFGDLWEYSQFDCSRRLRNLNSKQCMVSENRCINETGHFPFSLGASWNLVHAVIFRSNLLILFQRDTRTLLFLATDFDHLKHLLLPLLTIPLHCWCTSSWWIVSPPAEKSWLHHYWT